jgi:tRNA threonylcarbamoyladenosine biosynthesis protein TsaB
MLILTIDTSGKNGAVAISRAEGEVRVLGQKSLEGRQYSAQLVPAVAALLQELSLAKTDLNAIGVTAGPGSFTGLRVGLAAAKGLAEVLNLPLVAISVLEAMAVSSNAYGQTPRVSVAMDAGRQEAYIADCELHPAYDVRIQQQRLVKQADLVSQLDGFGGKQAVSPDRAIVELLRSGGLEGEEIAWPVAEVLGKIAESKLRRGVTVPVAELDADYIRRSDAEIFSAPFL